MKIPYFFWYLPLKLEPKSFSCLSSFSPIVKTTSDWNFYAQSLVSILFRWLIFAFYFSYIIIVPYCYIKIYQYRKNLTAPGCGQGHKELTKLRKARNIVTFSYNITIWGLEALSTLLVQAKYNFLFDSYLNQQFAIHKVTLCGYQIKDYEKMRIIKIAYITVTCGLTPGLYILGMQTETWRDDIDRERWSNSKAKVGGLAISSREMDASVWLAKNSLKHLNLLN